MSEIVRDALSKGKKNSMDCLITGIENSGTRNLHLRIDSFFLKIRVEAKILHLGTTSLFWSLAQDNRALNNTTKLQHSQEQPSQPFLDLNKQGNKRSRCALGCQTFFIRRTIRKTHQYC